jgi:hypothetical protein
MSIETLTLFGDITEGLDHLFTTFKQQKIE